MTDRPEPFCPDCGRWYTCIKNGVTVFHPKDYAYAADLWECPSCGNRVIKGFSAVRMWHWRDPKAFEEYIQNNIAYTYEVRDI